MKERHYTHAELGRVIADGWGFDRDCSIDKVIEAMTVAGEHRCLAAAMLQEQQKATKLLRHILRKLRRDSDTVRYRWLRDGTKQLLEKARYHSPGDIREAADSDLLKIKGIGPFWLADIRERFPYEGD